MAFFKSNFFYGFLFLSLYVNSFSKTFNINPNYNIPNSSISYSKKIKGKILNKNFKPIFNSKIEITNKKKKQIITSDNSGNFQIPFLKGITLIKISKPGYYPKIIIRNFKYSDSSNVFILNKYYYSILGTIISDVYPVNNSVLYLFSKNGTLLKKTQTNTDGNFSIANIPSNDCYIFIPETKTFKSYKSKSFKINNFTKTIYINLKKR